MKPSSNRLAACLLLVLASGASAAPGPALSKKAYTAMQSARELLDNSRSGPAVRTLQDALPAAEHRPYDRAVLLQSLAHAELSRDRPEAAIPHLEQSIALAELPDEAQQRARYHLAQLYLMTGRAAAAVAPLKEWLAAADPPEAEAYAMLGSAYLQLSQFRSARPALERAIALHNRPPESWYQGLLSAYNELKLYEHCTRLLRTLIRRFPERGAYWRQLAGIELIRDRYREALAVLELAYLRGFVESEADLVNLAQLYAQQGAPRKSAELTEQEIARGRVRRTQRNWELAANAWRQARELEKSAAALEEAFALSGGSIAVGLRLAQTYLDLNKPGDAQPPLDSIIQGDHEPELKARAWLLRGIACHHNRQPDLAKAAFDRAANSEATRRDAEQWLAFLRALE